VTLEKLNLTRPEKAILISAVCLFDTGNQPTIKNINMYLICDIKEILLYPGVIPLLELVCGKTNMSDLLRKFEIDNDL
jgi:hypothetical protein